MKSSNYPEINHEVIVITREDAVIFALPNGEEIASVKVSTMVRDGKKDVNGKITDVPTKNFWLQLIPTKKHYNKCMLDCASVCIE